MRCAWQAFLNLVPVWMREVVDKQGRDSLLELRLRLNSPPMLITNNNKIWLNRLTSQEDIQFCINVGSKYSPWSATTIANGYITASGGHRIGVCGEVITDGKQIKGIRTATSLCLRVARDFPGIAREVNQYNGSILIIGAPGCGKTTLLRDVVRQRSNSNYGVVGVVDEREEIFPRNNGLMCFPIGKNTDVLAGCGKAQGIEMLLRNVTPSTIAVDEITAKEDCEAMLHACWCGVKLVATAHAGSRNDLFSRPIYRPLIDNGIFDTVLILNEDKSWRTERMKS